MARIHKDLPTLAKRMFWVHPPSLTTCTTVSDLKTLKRAVKKCKDLAYIRRMTKTLARQDRKYSDLPQG